ncbi:MAG: hypothetical protein QNJ19_15795 [Woeseiaceae bacterium]|nr:hypothetical protein [Woeseiaceae bacterium]
MTGLVGKDDIGLRKGLSVGLMIALAVLALANLAFFVYVNQRGIFSLQGIGIYSVFVSAPIAVLSFVGWFASRRMLEHLWLRWLTLAPTVIVSVLLVALPWKWYVE